MEDSGASSSSGIFHTCLPCAGVTSVPQVTSKLYKIKFNHTNRLILCPILIKRYEDFHEGKYVIVSR